MSHETPEPARRFAREPELPIVCARKALVRVVESAREFAVARERDVDLLTLAERRDLADALPCATWSAVSAKTRVSVLDFLTGTDAAAIWRRGDESQLVTLGGRWRCHRRSA